MDVLKKSNTIIVMHYRLIAIVIQQICDHGDYLEIQERRARNTITRNKRCYRASNRRITPIVSIRDLFSSFSCPKGHT